jgi:DNA mismatch repair ATPase MutS
MQALLMHADRDFDVERALPGNVDALTADLELNTLLNAMAAGDPPLFEVARRALLQSLIDPDAITYRQQVLADCLQTPTLARDIYGIAGDALEAQRTVWGSILERDSPRLILRTSVRKMEILTVFLRRLRDLADTNAGRVASPGLSQFFAMLAAELDDDYFNLIERYLKELNLRGGLRFSARLSQGNKGADYTLRRGRAQGFLARMLDRSGYSFTIADRDEAGAVALAELEDRALNHVADALAQSVDHVLNFLRMLRTEVGFYVACLNLADALSDIGGARTTPDVHPVPDVALRAHGLYDVCLALTLKGQVVTNDVEASAKSLVMITGANQGGKSTFLRSVGLAQLMAQCGMFVGADSYCANACTGVYTHYKREEDETMESGKLDEELARMSDIADHIHAGCLLLCNESFASTNEREGSQIAREVIDAMLAENIKVMFVTHLFDLAWSYHQRRMSAALFLRAPRGDDGARPFRLTEGEPLPTSYGEDTYRKVFGSPISLRRTGPRRPL